jgi:hypothetical protein
MAHDWDKLRTELIFQLNGGNAHASLEKVVANFPYELQGSVPNGLPYSAWQLLEHLRIAQAEMLEFCTNPKYKDVKWPNAYWPESPKPSQAKSWEASVKQIQSDRTRFVNLISDTTSDLFAPFAWGDGQTLFHEACLIIDHNSYHLGEIVTLRRLLGAWPK